MGSKSEARRVSQLRGQNTRYIDKELEEGKPSDRYIDYRQFPGDPAWLAVVASTLASIWRTCKRSPNARQRQAPHCSPNAGQPGTPGILRLSENRLLGPSCQNRTPRVISQIS